MLYYVIVMLGLRLILFNISCIKFVCQAVNVKNNTTYLGVFSVYRCRIFCRNLCLPEYDFA